MIKKLLIAAAIFFGLPIVAAIVMVALGVEVDDPNPEKTAELYTKVAERISVLDAIADSPHQSWEEEKVCAKRAFEAGKKIEVVSYDQVCDYLDFEFDKTMAANDSIYDLVSLKLTSLDSRVKKSTSVTTLESIVSGGGLNYGHLAKVYDSKLLAVVRSEALNEPKTGVKFTGKFYGGSYKGSVRLLNVDTKEMICQVPFLVQSSDEIDKGLLERSASAIRDDFEKRMAQGKTAVSESLGGAPLAW